MENSIKLEPIPIGELLGKSFFIPDYQRGYRWTKTQVTQLLDDILDFALNPPDYKKGSEEKPFYCLQPLVVKMHDDEWEVIDGQQRLTTIALIIHYCNEMWVGKLKIPEPLLKYQTRPKSSDFISQLEINIETKEIKKNDDFDIDDNIDFFHIAKAYETIHEWGLINNEHNEKFRTVFKEDTKVIWYKVEENENESLIDIFTRLNDGKIPLTNAELIKALFLQKRNFLDNEVSLKQIQISSEWDMIEKTLQDDSFWFFIYNPENPLKYDNRIEYIFDLMSGRTKDSAYYHTYDGFNNLMNGETNDTEHYPVFNEIYNDLTDNLNSNKPKIEDVWLEIKKYFLTFEEWFKDYELYHYIGYLIDCNKDNKDDINTFKTIKRIKEKSSNKTITKTKFKEYLKSEIQKQIGINIDIDSLEYGDSIIKKILLLFNIQTVLQTQKSDMRFPFHKYKSDNWDIEHVRSQTDKEFKSEKDQRTWIEDIIEYFTGCSKIEEAIKKLSEEKKEGKEEIIELSDEERSICNQLIKLYQSEKIEEDLFKKLLIQISELFKESKPLVDNISNLALLDSETNRSYKNAFFPIKRKRIIENDKNGIFVPICTKNLFLKYYSKKLGEVMYWKEDDATDYLEAIKETYKNFFKEKEDKQ
jgi:uncharacterized protein with ParB-like and HNH nuclease domain